MERAHWSGVFPAITTPFDAAFALDEESLREHVSWLVESGCDGIVPLGSLGEASTLTFDEKVRVLEVAREAIDGRVPLVAGVSCMGTAEGVALARAAESAGCDGLMVLPPYVHKGDWKENRAHFSALLDATPLSCMFYNNPIAYGVDVTPEQIGSLAERHENLHAVKESSGDVRRVTALKEALGDRLAVFVGVDDLIVEGVAAGAEGWIAGLVNALPEESIRLFELARSGSLEEVRPLYEWFLPLLRLDLGPKFVQQIKLVQQELDRGSARVRPPRLELAGAERTRVLEVIRSQLEARPLPEGPAALASTRSA